MRLIDANKYLEKACTYKETGCGSCKFQIVCPVDEPTVEAIPVEWISKQIYEHSNDETLYANLLWLLRKWYWEEEKENEID